MLDHLDLTQLASVGELLATIDDTAYRAIQIVLACPARGEAALYCPYQDWATTPAARLAAKDQEIAALAARVAELEKALAAQTETPTQSQEAMFRKQTAALDDPGPCPDCGRHEWHSARALQMHRQRAHQGMQTPKQRAQPPMLPDDAGWCCAEPGCRGAFTRSLSDPDHCAQHAIHTNGNGARV